MTNADPKNSPAAPPASLASTEATGQPSGPEIEPPQAHRRQRESFFHDRLATAFNGIWPVGGRPAADAMFSQRIQAILSLAQSEGIQLAGDHSLLSTAAANGFAQCVSLLLDHVDARRRDDQGFTALMVAARRSHPECVRILLPHSDPKAWNADGNTAFFLAARSCCVEAMEILAPVSDMGAPSNDGSTPLMAIAQQGNAAWALRLLNAGVDARAQNQDGTSALMFAAEHGQADCVRVLLPHSDPMQVNWLARSAFDSAREGARWACADLLFEFADPAVAAEMFDTVGEQHFPRMKAHREQKALSRLVKAAPAQSDADGWMPAPAVARPPRSL